MHTRAAQRLQDLAAQLDGEVEAARREGAAALNQIARRLRLSRTEEEWASALLDGAAAHATCAAVFTVDGPNLRLEKSRPPLDTCEIALSEAPAMAEALRNGELVVAARSEGELSVVWVEALGSSSETRAYLVPVGARGVLYAEGGAVDTAALELLAAFAGLVRQTRAAAPAPNLVAIQPAPVSEDAELHGKAQRFARVQVAEMRLYKAEAVKQGRATGALYSQLREEIDRAREQYRTEFLNSGHGLADYLHSELVRTLANDNAALLGDDYPGPLC